MDKKWRPAQRDGSKPYKKGSRGPGTRRFVEPDSSTAAEDLAEYVMKVLVRDSESLKITRESPNAGYSRLTVTCDPDLTGRIIGKSGRTITALRLLVRTIAGEHGKRVDIEVS